MTLWQSEVFYWLFNMSISASIVGGIVYLMDKIRRIPRKIICVLWFAPFLRMWIPIGVNSKYSLMSLISKFTTKTVAVYEGDIDFSMMNFVMGADTYFPITYKMDLLKNVFGVAAVVWIIIAITLVVTMTILYFSTKAELKDMRHWRDNVYLSNKVSSPVVYGVFRGKILLPQKYDESDLKFILMHENAHIRRGDNLWRIAAMVTACVHWFNPLSWLFLKSFLESMELACDEAVLRHCTAEEKKNYAKTLLTCAESKDLYASAFRGARIRVRIERILSYKKLSVLSVIAFAILAMMVGYVLLTNAK